MIEPPSEPVGPEIDPSLVVPGTPVPEVSSGTSVPEGAEFRVVLVTSVALDLPAPHPTVVLREAESPRRQLSFQIGLAEGTALSHALRRVPTPRPLTHELVSDVLSAFDIDVTAVRLVGRSGKTYFAELDLRGRSGRSVHACRPSDGLALALRRPVPVPILVDARLFEAPGDVAPAAQHEPRPV